MAQNYGVYEGREENKNREQNKCKQIFQTKIMLFIIQVVPQFISLQLWLKNVTSKNICLYSVNRKTKIAEK